MWKKLTSLTIAFVSALTFSQSNNGQASVSSPSYFQLSDSYENYLLSTCNFAAMVGALSPNRDINLTLISSRLARHRRLVIRPTFRKTGKHIGNTGAVAYFAPTYGVNGTLSTRVVNDRAKDSFQALSTNPTEGKRHLGGHRNHRIE